MAIIDDVKQLIESISSWTYDKTSMKVTTATGANINVLARSISTDAHRGADAAQIKIRMSSEECEQILKSQRTDEKTFILAITPDTDSGKYACGGLTEERLVLSLEGMTEIRNALSVRPAIIDARDYFVAHPDEMLYRYIPEKGNKLPIGAISVIRAYSSIDALENYLTNFDNRPYRNIVYSEIDYIQVSSCDGEEVMSVVKYPYNWLISGAPGTGKSYGLDKAVIDLLCNKSEKDIIDEYVAKDTTEDDLEKKTKRARKQLNSSLAKYIHRVTFYEDYAYENFIGCYKPLPIENDATKITFDGKTGAMFGSKIVYMYEPGPFIDILVKATNDPEHKYCLIIEEINRAKAASVFGDIFQLLDRTNGESVYGIVPESALNKYLFDSMDGYTGELRLPNNLYIWATMNSADQGVYPLDSAFKRRWSYCCKDVFAARSGEGVETEIAFFFEGKLEKALWDNFRKLINNKIELVAEEDKFVGPWYFTDSELKQIQSYQSSVIEKTSIEATNPLVEKLFLYLRNDVFRNDPEEMFIGGKSISTIMHEYSNCDGALPSIETVLNIEASEFRKIIIPVADVAVEIESTTDSTPEQE